VKFTKTYYLLTRECEDATASAVTGEVYLSGGAGYLIQTDGKYRVALSCYFAPEHAKSVQTTLNEKGVETEILTLVAEPFVLSGRKAAIAGTVDANLSTLDSLACLLYDTANGLERCELTQDEARAAVRGAVKSLKGLREGNGEGLSEWNEVLYSAEKKAREIGEGILFAKDVRYLQVQLCMAAVFAQDYV